MAGLVSFEASSDLKNRDKHLGNVFELFLLLEENSTKFGVFLLSVFLFDPKKHNSVPCFLPNIIPDDPSL